MKIISTCTHCHKGKVKAPRSLLGQSVTCPKCQNEFLFNDPSDEIARMVAADLAGVAASGSATPVAASPAVQRSTATISLPPTDFKENTQDGGILHLDAGMPWALMAFTFGGLAFLSTLFPYGRIAMIVFAVPGCLCALAGIMSSDLKKWIPRLALGQNATALLIALLFPYFLGVASWIPPVTEPEKDKVFAVSNEDAVPRASEWINAVKETWQLNDVRVAVRSAAVGSIEGTPGKKTNRNRFLVIEVEVLNKGVVRQIEFAGWKEATLEVPGPVCTDSFGTKLAWKSIEADWKLPGHMPNAALPPGRSAPFFLVFEPPGQNIEYIRLELPGTAFGSPSNTVKLQIPRSAIQWR